MVLPLPRWSEFDPIGESGREAVYEHPRFRARLVVDCHGDARKLDVELLGEAPPDLIAHLRPFARPGWVAAHLQIIDRPAYFRLYVIPTGVRALLRKAADEAVVAQLIAQLERAVAATACATCPGLCKAGALSYAAGRLQIDDTTCTACLDCVLHHPEARHRPPTLDLDSENP